MSNIPTRELATKSLHKALIDVDIINLVYELDAILQDDDCDHENIDKLREAGVDRVELAGISNELRDIMEDSYSQADVYLVVVVRGFAFRLHGYYGSYGFDGFTGDWENIKQVTKIITTYEPDL